jgi:hypothetical protein
MKAKLIAVFGHVDRLLYSRAPPDFHRGKKEEGAYIARRWQSWHPEHASSSRLTITEKYSIHSHRDIYTFNLLQIFHVKMSKTQEETDDAAGSAPSGHSKEQVAASASPADEGQDQQELMDGLAVTEDDLLEAREMAAALSLDEVIKVSDIPHRQFHTAPNTTSLDDETGVLPAQTRSQLPSPNT